MGILGSVINAYNKSNMDTKNTNTALVSEILQTPFTRASSFRIKSFHNSYFNFVPGAQILSSMNTSFLDDMSVAALSVDISQVSSDNIQEWMNQKWEYTYGKPVINRITITFRDYSNNTLYTAFNAAFWSLKDKLPDTQKWNIRIDSLNDMNSFANRSFGEKEEITSPIFYSDDAIIESVGAATLDKENTDGIFTFSVTFRYFINQLEEL